VKGYDVEEILNEIEQEKKITGKPSVIVLDTLKGLGCNFAEQAAFNHYMVITQEMADDAVEEIERRYREEIEGGKKYVPPCI
jgi:transketolase